MPDQTSNRGRLKPPQNIPPAGYRCLPVSIPDDNEYIAAFVGAVSKLARTSTWEFTDPARQHGAAEVWNGVLAQLLETLSEGVGCEVPTCDEGGCIEIGAHHPALTYYPNNPITQPDFAGPYVDHVWTTGSGYIGAGPADSMIDILAMAGQDIGTMLAGGIAPSIELNFTGSGEIDVQFLSTIQGGLVWGYPDGNPLVGDLVNLQYTDIFSLAGTATLAEVFEVVFQADQEAFVTTHSWDFATTGPHTLTLIFFPSVEIEPPFLGVGGGLRSVQLCGDITIDEVVDMPGDLVVDGGKLRVTVDGVPTGTGVDLEDLADLIDRWVDEDGDTMTGTLVHNPDDTIAQEFQYSGVEKGHVQAASGALRLVSEKALELQSNGGDGAAVQLRSVDVIIREDITTDAPALGGVRVGGNNPDAALSVMNVDADGDAQHWYDNDDVLRAAVDQLGRAVAAQFNGWDYSSTDWRQQFGIDGEWTDATDATRHGGMTLNLYRAGGSDSVIRLGYVGDTPRAGFFDGDGNSPRPMTYLNQTSARLDEALAELVEYGLLGPYTAENIGAPIPAWQCCNAGHYIASTIAGLITAAYDGVDAGDTLTDILQSMGGTVDATTAQFLAIVGDIFDLFSSASTIVADLGDVDSLGDDICAADFDLETVVAGLGGYGWASATQQIVETALRALWAENDTLQAMIGLGRYIDAGACSATVFACGENIDIDFRWGSAGGAQIVVGALVFSEGVAVAYDGSTYYNSYIQLDFEDNCSFSTGSVQIYMGASGTGQIHHYTKNPDGSYTDGLVAFPALAAGENTVAIGAFSGARLRIWTGSAFAPYTGYIRRLSLTPV